MSSDVVKRRELRTRYETNRDIKAYALYVWLKNMTVAGFVHNYELQHEAICKALKISRATFYNYLNYAEGLQLLKRKGSRLELSGWDRVVEALMLSEKKFTTIYYDTENPKQKLSLILEALEFKENKDKQDMAIVRKIAKNPQVKSAFEIYCSSNNITADFSPENLKAVQKLIYQYGSAASIYPVLMYSVNPETYRNSSSIAAAHGYKSPRLTTYLKRKLQRAQLAIVSKGKQTPCRYNKNRMEGRERGKNTNATTYYKVNDKVKLMIEPDIVTISQFLFTPPPAQGPQNPQI